ncbi:MAG: cellulose synthase operon protein YhjQ/BcsQ [Acidobacteriaceae bacterium]
MSDAQPPTPPGKDVRALFDKAKIGDVRYRTFAPQKTPAKNEPQHTPALSKQEPPAVAPAAEVSAPRRALSALFDGNAGLRIAGSRVDLPAGSGATLTFVSAAGGVGKTTLCATSARILSSRLNNLLVADRCVEGIIPYYFGLDRLRAGGLQVVYPNTRRTGYQMTLVNVPCDKPLDTSTPSWLEQLQAESTLTLVDLPTCNGRSTQNKVVRAGQVVIPLTPDVQSIASLGLCEELFGHLAEGENARSLFVLNRFDEARGLHREIRTHLEKVLQGRLAPIALRESESVAEALSLGMTVVDHAPQSPVTKDFEQLVQWLEESLAKTSAEKMEIA